MKKADLLLCFAAVAVFVLLVGMGVHIRLVGQRRVQERNDFLKSLEEAGIVILKGCYDNPMIIVSLSKEELLEQVLATNRTVFWNESYIFYFSSESACIVYRAWWWE